jgi:hypothetical protein
MNPQDYAHLNPHGLPFHQYLGENIKKQVERVLVKKKASIIVIDGGSGEGKTTLGVELADYINELTGKKKIIISRENPQFSYGYLDFSSKLPKTFEQNYNVIVYDEGGDFSTKRTLSKINFFLNRIFETYRAFKVIVIICLPLFNDLDSGLFKKKLVRLLIHVHNKQPTYSKMSIYGIKRINDMRRIIKKMNDIEAGYYMVRPNFRGKFYNLSPARDKELDDFVTKLKLGETKDQNIKLSGYVSFQDICRATGLVGRVVRQKIAKLKIKPALVVQRKHYFNEEIIKSL